MKVWYEGELKMDWNVSRAGCYFKAGCYTQSNPSKGDEPDAYGEVVIYRLQVDYEPGGLVLCQGLIFGLCATGFASADRQ